MDAHLINVLVSFAVFSAACYAVLLGCVLIWWRPRSLLPQSSICDQPNQLTVVIAARDEAENVGSCLQSLLNQPGIAQIIVVDDHSTDATAAVVESFCSRDGLVVLLSAPELPPGWLGKSHALHFGAKQVTTPFLLFTDADVIFGPGIIAAALQKMSAARLDHLGGHFFVDCRSVAEEVCAPVLVLSSGLALFGTANSRGAGTGAFNMVRTATYRAYGGHTPTKNEIVDDVALTRHLKACGASSEFVAMGDYLKVRLFVGFDGFVNSVTRSAVPFLRLGGMTACLLATLCMAVALLPVASLLGAIVVGVSAPARGPAVIACLLGPLAYCFGFIAVCVGRRLHNGRLLFQLYFPFAAFALAATVFYSALAQIRRRPVTWRGRVYAIDQDDRVLQSPSRQFTSKAVSPTSLSSPEARAKARRPVPSRSSSQPKPLD